MASAPTYTPIATSTLGSNGTFSFSSIPQTYTDLVLIFNGTSTYTSDSGAWLKMQVGNGSVDTGANYSNTYLTGNGSIAGSNRLSGLNNAYVCHIADNNNTTGNTSPSVGVIHIMNYSNTTTYKTILARGSATTNSTAVDAVVSLWRGTSAINTIYLFCDGTNFVTGSSVTLYGIASA